MTTDRYFIDTAYVQALLDRRDKHHSQAIGLSGAMRNAREVFVSEAVLIEIANALSSFDRLGAAAFIRSCYQTSNIRVVPVDNSLIQRSLALYEARPDKAWGLTDCISFVIMQDYKLSEALTSDNHFRQAGFRALLSDER